MNWKTWTPLVVAAVLGVGAAKLARDLVVKRRPAEAPAASSVQIVIAKRPMLPGQPIALQDLDVTAVLGERPPEGAFTNPAELVGRVPLIYLGQNQPVFKTLLAESGAGTGLQALLPDGKRAISMEINEFSGVAGLLVPGCRVDVVASLHDGKGASVVTRTLVQNVKVVAIGQRMSDPNAKADEAQLAKSVTLVVTPEQAEAIELASMSARPRLVLRPGTDNAVVETAGTTLSQLTGRADETPATAVAQAAESQPEPKKQPDPFVAPPVVAQRTVTVIRGTTESTVTFRDDRPIAAPETAVEETVTHTDQQPVIRE
jgi:pilus assembly protein CpaB